MDKKLWVQRYRQNDQRITSFVMDYETISRLSREMVYGESAYGYQRPPDKKHYAKIKKYLLEDSQAVLPSAILMGVDAKTMDRYICYEHNRGYLAVENIDAPLFRVIDGQHRLKALAEAVKVKPELNSFQLQVIAIETDVLTRKCELDVFIDINTKAKKIPVDLALVAKYNYEVYSGAVDGLEEHIAVKTAYKLKENRSDGNVWRNGIYFDSREDKALGIISVNAFVRSIQPMCRRYIRDIGFDVKAATVDERHQMTEEASDFMIRLLLAAWAIIAEKWGGCFLPTVESDQFSEIKEYYYHRNYYIQKSLGVRVLNAILYDTIRRGKIQNYNLGRFYRTIIASNINIINWSTGDVFAGLSSEAGFKVAKSYILNKRMPESTL